MVSDSDFFNLINNDEDAEAELKMLSAQQVSINYEEFLELLFLRIDEFIHEIEKQADYLSDASEDAITAHLASQLNATKFFDAKEQTYQRGAVDLTVNYKKHTWRAEAKIAYSNDKIFEGLLQLLTRYVVRDTNVGLLVYVVSGSFKNKFNSWKSYTQNDGDWESYVENKKRKENQTIISNLMATSKIQNIDNFKFKSSFELDNGNRISVKNFFVNLIFNPADKSGDGAKKHQKRRANHELARIYFEKKEDEKKHLVSDEIMMYLDMLYKDLDSEDYTINIQNKCP